MRFIRAAIGYTSCLYTQIGSSATDSARLTIFKAPARRTRPAHLNGD